MIVGLDCRSCGRKHKPADAPYTCPNCGANLFVRYDLARAKRALTRAGLAEDPRRNLWRYLPLLPVRAAPPAGAPAGWTPLFEAPRLAKAAGLERVWVKDDGRNPSASFKDRASAVVVARALESGRKVIAAASTGNAASSLACLAAGSSAKTVIFVPKTAPAPKIAQLLVFGASVLAVDGTYDDAFDLCVEACREFGWYNRNTGFNPFTREGKKTCSFELCEQLGWRVPDWVFVPVGDGNILTGIWKGFREFKELGLIPRLPKLAAIQAEGSDSISTAFERDAAPAACPGRTVADSIAVSIPRDGAAAVAALKESFGAAVRVSDAEILAAIPELARGANVFAEPAASASWAGLKKARREGIVGRRETAVLLVTGNGLKDVESARRVAGEPHRIKPRMQPLRALVRRGL